MAPNPLPRRMSIENSAEYLAFIKGLQEYHQRRGTNFEREPKIGQHRVDLYRLYNTVTARGGYDRVSEEKLAWKNLGQIDFKLDDEKKPNPAIGFLLKTIYYKLLAAYEISTFWGKDPPPKEILEEQTARGAGILTRTLDNYQPPGRSGGLGNEHSEASGDDGTPVRARNASEELPGSGGRATRGLRAQPPQRVLYQDAASTQQSRSSKNLSVTSHSTSSQGSNHLQQHHQPAQAPRGPSTYYNPPNSLENSSPAVANYEPRPISTMNVNPVVTPGNNPIGFANQEKAARDRAAALAGRLPNANKGIMFPGTGFDGPNIYVRCLKALQSEIKAEQDYALHHLVKISMERGDKFRFEGFPGLAEALTDKVLEVGALFFKVDWQVTYLTDEGKEGPQELNGAYGTPDVLQKIAALERLNHDDNIQSEGFCDSMLQINEAGLTLRNMVMLDENAHYLSGLYPPRDFLTIALNLPNYPSVVELKHYALEIAEQLTKYWRSDETDPLYKSLLAQLQSEDRGAILTSLRALGRFSMNLEENNVLKGVPLSVIEKIINWTFLNDDELVSVSLDFLYQYTAVVENVDQLLKSISLAPFVTQLSRLLLHNAKTSAQDVPLGHDYSIPAPQSLARLPGELYRELLKLAEPERSSVWLRSLFEEDPSESITQIALWQAYQQCFSNAAQETNTPLLAAAEFIKNVSTTFAEKAAAQVQSGAVQKFIIKGIRYRSTPIDKDGNKYRKCEWKSAGSGGNTSICGEWFMDPELLYNHIILAHLSATQRMDGKFENARDGPYTCAWDGCTKYLHDKNPPEPTLALIARHISLHATAYGTVPKKSQSASQDDTKRSSASQQSSPSYIVRADKYVLEYTATPADENLQPLGIAYAAVLVLRNLALTIPKTDADEKALKAVNGTTNGVVSSSGGSGSGGVSYVDVLFKPIEPHLFKVWAYNKTLCFHMADLICDIRARETNRGLVDPNLY